MKTLQYFLFIILIAGCKKIPFNKQVVNLKEEAMAYFVANGKTVFDETSLNASKSMKRYPRWDASIITKAGKLQKLLVPVNFEKELLAQLNRDTSLYSLNDITFLEMTPSENGEFNIKWLTVIPLNRSENVKFGGIIKVEKEDGKFDYAYKYENGKRFLSSSHESKMQTEGVIRVDYYAKGYNYSPDDPNNGYAWQEYMGSSYIYIPDGPNNYEGGLYEPGGYADPLLGGLSELADDISAKNIIVPAGDNTIADIAAYNKCFTNKPGSSFQITLYVQQPFPNSRTTWRAEQGPNIIKSKSPVFVGHTFLALKQTTGTETTIRNIGYYPTEAVDPLSPITSGALNNDENRRYDISLSINLSYEQFSQIVSYINSGVRYYNLNTFNCTTFALEALSKGGINLPRTNGSWPNGGGLNPGDLGEDIRGLNPASNMTKSTNVSTHKNAGSCN